MSTATLTTLNETDNAAAVGGLRIGDDGQGNELWLFGEKVANRFQNEDGEIFWSADIEGWNCTKGDAIPS